MSGEADGGGSSLAEGRGRDPRPSTRSSGAEAPAVMDVETALKLVLKNALVHDGVAALKGYR